MAAIAATVLLFGGVFGQDTAARPGPFAAEAGVKRGYAELELARVRVDPSRYPVAEARFREAMRIGGADALALRGLASLAAARHRFDQSLELARRARKLDPTNAAVYGLIGDASLELGRFPQAIEAFDRMMSLKPTPSGYARVSYARELLGERDGAIEAMQMSADAAGHSEPAAWALTHLGNLQVGTGGLALGVQQYRAALARVPAYAPALVGLADVAQRRGQRARAERLLRRALAQVDDPGASARLGDVLAQQGHTDEANDWYRRSLALETTSPATAAAIRSRRRCSTSTTTATSPTRSSVRGSACGSGRASRVFTPTRGRCTRTAAAPRRSHTRIVHSRWHPPTPARCITVP